jgi:glycosyltransferase involved in cell wall biosynthesis
MSDEPMPSISTTVITFNEERNIERCIRSVTPFSDEIIVVDSGSTDRTPEIAHECGARVITNEWPGYGKQKQFALEQTSSEWVFSIDADEEVSPELCAEIQALDFTHAGYKVPRPVWYLNRWVKHGVWYPGYVLRLFRRNAGRFSEDTVHESVEISGSIGRLKGDLLHYSFRDIDHHMVKMNEFTTLAANQMYGEGRRAGIHHMVFTPFFEFLKVYFSKRGFLDGTAGFVIAFLHSVYVFEKYSKLYELGLAPADPQGGTASDKSAGAPK